MHTGLIHRLRERSSRIADPQNAVNLANWLSEVFADVAPIGRSRTLIRNLRVVGELKVEADGVYSIGIGEGAGSPDDKAPRGTIADFLEAYPQFKTKKGIPSRLAWWVLSGEAKATLQQEREAGRFGGETGVGAGRSPYLWVQDGTTPGGLAGAAKASIQPQEFLRTAMEAFSRHIPEYVRELIGA